MTRQTLTVGNPIEDMDHDVKGPIMTSNDPMQQPMPRQPIPQAAPIPDIPRKQQGWRGWMVALIVGVGLVAGVAGGIGGGLIYHATMGGGQQMQMPGGSGPGGGQSGDNGQPPALPDGEQPGGQGSSQSNG